MEGRRGLLTILRGIRSIVRSRGLLLLLKTLIGESRREQLASANRRLLEPNIRIAKLLRGSFTGTVVGLRLTCCVLTALVVGGTLGWRWALGLLGLLLVGVPELLAFRVGTRNFPLSVPSSGL